MTDINKKLIANSIAVEYDITKAQAEAIVGSVFYYVGEHLIAGNDVNIDKFGKFAIDIRAARIGRNPATGKEIEIAAKTVVKFKPAKALKDAVA